MLSTMVIYDGYIDNDGYRINNREKMIYLIICFHTQLEVFCQTKFTSRISSWDEIHV